MGSVDGRQNESSPSTLLMIILIERRRSAQETAPKERRTKSETTSAESFMFHFIVISLDSRVDCFTFHLLSYFPPRDGGSGRRANERVMMIMNQLLKRREFLI